MNRDESALELCGACFNLEGAENLEVVPYKQFLGDGHGGMHCLYQLDGLPNLQRQQWLALFE
jgi:hypothetical protein